MSRTSVGRRTTSKKSTNNAYGQSGGEHDMYDSERHGEVKDVKIASTFSEISPKDLVTASNAPKTSAANNISAAIHYINSILPANEGSCKNIYHDGYNKSNQSNNSSQRQHLIFSDDFCTNAKSAVDTICKFLKNDRAKDPEG